jgi:hypothetical protein
VTTWCDTPCRGVNIDSGAAVAAPFFFRRTKSVKCQWVEQVLWRATRG